MTFDSSIVSLIRFKINPVPDITQYRAFFLQAGRRCMLDNLFNCVFEYPFYVVTIKLSP